MYTAGSCLKLFTYLRFKRFVHHLPMKTQPVLPSKEITENRMRRVEGGGEGKRVGCHGSCVSVFTARQWRPQTTPSEQRERELANNLFRIMHRVKSLVAYSSLSVCLGLLCSCLSASASVSVFSVFLCFNQRSFVDKWTADRPNDNNENKNDDVVLIEVVPRKVSMPSVHRRAKCKLHVFFFLKRPFCRDSAHCFNESIWRDPSPLLSD